MTYNNYPIKYADQNLIPRSPASDAILEDYNRQFIYHTFCDLPSDDEEFIVIKAIDAFYNDEDDDAICENDFILTNIADEIDPRRKIDRQKLNMLLLERCDGLKVVFIDVDKKIMPHFVIAKDAYTMVGLIGVHLVGCGIEPYFAEKIACEIADDLALTPSEIVAIILEQVEFEEFNEDVFDFDFDDEEEIFANTEELFEQMDRKSREHEKNSGRKNCDEQFRKLVAGFLSPQEQESFLKIANEFLKNKNSDPQDQ